MAAAGLGVLLLLLLAAPCAGQRHGEPGGWEGAGGGGRGREKKGREERGEERAVREGKGGPEQPTRAEGARPGVPHTLW